MTEDEQVLFAAKYSHRIRKVDQNGIISTIAGNGIGFVPKNELTNETLDMPSSVFQYKNDIYIADVGNHRIVKKDQHGTSTTIAKVNNGVTGDAFPIFVHNDEVYFTDGKGLLFKTSITGSGNVQIIAGIEYESGFNGRSMLATKCVLDYPKGIFIDDDSQIYIADTYNHCIRKIDKDGNIRIIVGTGDKGYSGDVPFDFQRYPHIGPKKKKQWIKPFPHALYDLIVICCSEIHED